MDGAALLDKVARGMGRAARKLGQEVAVYRPHGTCDPLSTRNRVIRLSAWFDGSGGAKAAPPGYSSALWMGVFDSAYTQPGDYLTGPQGVFFVAQQAPALPAQCVLTNSVVSLVRDSPADVGGYGGLYGGPVETVITGWPASLLQSGSRGVGGGERETRFATWTLLLPVLPVIPQVADVVQDDRSQTYLVGAAEECALGWRLTVRQVGA